MKKQIKSQKIKKSAQEIQNDIFRKMSADKKVRLALKLSKFCLKLNKLNNKK